MKFLIPLLLACSISSASIPPQRQYRFTYRLNENAETKKFQCFGRGTYDQVYQACAQECFDHFRAMDLPFTEERGLDIIDSCANPRGE